MNVDSSPVSVLVHIVTHNSSSIHGAEAIQGTINAVLRQHGFTSGNNLFLILTDNGSTDSTPDILNSFSGAPGVEVILQHENTGFCGAHNSGAYEFLNRKLDYLLILNPDLTLEDDALSLLVSGLEANREAGSACPRLFQQSESGENTIDSTGIVMTPALRHLDRGQGQNDNLEYEKDCFVFGGSGACLLCRREFVEEVSFRSEFDEDLFKVYPQLRLGYENRIPLFDEAFFAYRDDAELAWRSQYLGWKCLYVAGAKGYHLRVVTPERRESLPPEINMLGVQNRFLLQRSLYFFKDLPQAFLPGIIFRNAVVIVGVILIERKSLPAFSRFKKLYRRAKARSSYVASNRKNRKPISRWFSNSAYTEPVDEIR